MIRKELKEICKRSCVSYSEFISPRKKQRRAIRNKRRTRKALKELEVLNDSNIAK